MPCMSSAESVLPGLKPYQPNHRIRPPTAPRMMLWGRGGPAAVPRNPVREQRNARRQVGLGQAVEEEALQADEAVARLEHEGKAPGPERHAADAGVDDAF